MALIRSHEAALLDCASSRQLTSPFLCACWPVQVAMFWQFNQQYAIICTTPPSSWNARATTTSRPMHPRWLPFVATSSQACNTPQPTAAWPPRVMLPPPGRPRPQQPAAAQPRHVCFTPRVNTHMSLRKSPHTSCIRTQSAGRPPHTLSPVTPASTPGRTVVRRLLALPAASTAAPSSPIMSLTLAVMAVRTASSLPSKAVMAAWCGPSPAAHIDTSAAAEAAGTHTGVDFPMQTEGLAACAAQQLPEPRALFSLATHTPHARNDSHAPHLQAGSSCSGCCGH